MNSKIKGDLFKMRVFGRINYDQRLISALFSSLEVREVSCKTWSFVLEPGENSLFFLRVSPVLRLAHGNTWISPRRDIKDGYSCIIRIIVSMTKSTEFIHSKDVFFLTPSRWEAEKVFYWSSAKLQEQVHPEDKFSIRLVVFQPGRVTSKPLTFWTQTALPFLCHGEQWAAALEEGIP